jgi:hypothetical protein
MAKPIFDGAAFLAEATIPLKFSNGFEAKVVDIPDAAMDEFEQLSKVENPTVEDTRKIVASMLKCESSDLRDVLIRELNGAASFLFTNMS